MDATDRLSAPDFILSAMPPAVLLLTTLSGLGGAEPRALTTSRWGEGRPQVWGVGKDADTGEG